MTGFCRKRNVLPAENSRTAHSVPAGTGDGAGHVLSAGIRSLSGRVAGQIFRLLPAGGLFFRTHWNYWNCRDGARPVSTGIPSRRGYFLPAGGPAGQGLQILLLKRPYAGSKRNDRPAARPGRDGM
jgi:hypothetical protein